MTTSSRSLADDPNLDLKVHFADLDRQQVEQVVTCFSEKQDCEAKLRSCDKPDNSAVVWVGLGLFVVGLLIGGAAGR